MMSANAMTTGGSGFLTIAEIAQNESVLLKFLGLIPQTERVNSISMLSVLTVEFATEIPVNVPALMAMKAKDAKEQLAPMIALAMEPANILKICTSPPHGTISLLNTSEMMPKLLTIETGTSTKLVVVFVMHFMVMLIALNACALMGLMFSMYETIYSSLPNIKFKLSIFSVLDWINLVKKDLALEEIILVITLIIPSLSPSDLSLMRLSQPFPSSTLPGTIPSLMTFNPLF